MMAVKKLAESLSPVLQEVAAASAPPAAPTPVHVTTAEDTYSDFNFWRLPIAPLDD